MGKRKLLIGIVLVLCIMLSTLVSSAESNDSVDGESLKSANKVQVFTIGIGDGKDELGYSGVEWEGYIGPSAFAVEKGVVYILDTVNGRISIHDNIGWKNNIVLTDCSEAEYMKFQNGILGVVDNQKAVTGLYSISGELIELIDHPDYVDEEYVAELSEIGGSYVIWRTFQENYYKYDWENGSCEKVTNKEVKVDDEFEQKKLAGLIDTKAKNVYSVSKTYNPLSIFEGNLIYEQYEYISDVDIFLGEYSLRKISSDGQETYAIIDTSDWYAPALSPFHVSSDGSTYVMENKEDCVRISRVVFGTTDISRIAQLEEDAQERRLEIADEDKNYDVRRTTLTATYTRPVAYSRADGMTRKSWVVLEGHQRLLDGTTRIHLFAVCSLKLE